ncbi:SUMF1/EgtB/PvdO family nonheme iron enzyme [Candidatus Uabimicrobium sp. HlEnr_7]|uniref:SUMF1/EgtB/PvdO family nonheme iron enzyme n=1 Tax=Candidatus Uabimicrobium helgolandensis TaxID=3095367 RepID=UPI003558C4E3
MQIFSNGITNAAGNVLEWILNFYGEYIAADAAEKPEDIELDIVRGGCWEYRFISSRFRARKTLHSI